MIGFSPNNKSDKLMNMDDGTMSKNKRLVLISSIF